MNIKKIINNYGFLGPLHGNGFVNHIPMSQYSLYKLGADENRIIDYTESNIAKWNIKPADEGVYKIEDIKDGLGQRNAYSSYNKYYLDKIENEGIREVTNEVLNKLSKGLGTALFHGIIRVAYGVESDNTEEICRGLSFYSSSYRETEFTEKSIPTSSLKDELNSFIMSKKEFFYMDGSPFDKEVALLDCLLDLYLKTASFIVLHTITGLHALVLLKEYYDDYNHVLDRYTVCVLHALSSIQASDIKGGILEHNEHNWEEMFSLAISVNDVHTHKFTYTNYCLSKLYPLSNFKDAANVKLRRDHNI